MGKIEWTCKKCGDHYPILKWVQETNKMYARCVCGYYERVKALDEEEYDGKICDES